MTKDKEKECLKIIEELQKCKGVGALIASIHTNRLKFDKDFFSILDQQISEASEKGNQKFAGSLSYLSKIMDNLQVRQNLPGESGGSAEEGQKENKEKSEKPEEEKSEKPEEEKSEKPEKEKSEKPKEISKETKSKTPPRIIERRLPPAIYEDLDRGDLINGLMKIVDNIVQGLLSVEGVLDEVKSELFLKLANKDIMLQLNALCNKLITRVPPNAHILAKLIYEMSNKLKDDELIIKTSLTLTATMNLLGMYKESVKLSHMMLPAVEENNDIKLTNILLGNIGNSYYNLGEVEEAKKYYNKGLKQARQIGNLKQEGSSLNNLGNAYYRLGEFDKAKTFYSLALEISKKVGDKRGENYRLGNLANIHMEFEEIDKAIECYSTALEISKELKDIKQAGTILGNLGNAYYKMGEIEEAINCYNQALEIGTEIKDRRGEGHRLGNLGNAHSEIGELEEAIDYYLASLNISKEIKDKRQTSSTLGNLGNTYYKLGEIEEATGYYTQAIEISKEIKDVVKEKNWNYNLGLLCENNMQDYDKAYKHYEEAIRILEEIKNKIKKDELKTAMNETNAEMYGKMIILCLKMQKDDEWKKIIENEPPRALKEILQKKLGELNGLNKEETTEEEELILTKLPKLIKKL